jgi:hypothetical protein
MDKMFKKIRKERDEGNLEQKKIITKGIQT